MRPLPVSTLFPYTTLFRSGGNKLTGAGDFSAGVADLTALGLKYTGSADRKSTRLNSSHRCNSYAACCVKKKKSGPTRTESTGGGAQNTRGNEDMTIAVKVR